MLRGSPLSLQKLCDRTGPLCGLSWPAGRPYLRPRECHLMAGQDLSAQVTLCPIPVTAICNGHLVYGYTESATRHDL